MTIFERAWTWLCSLLEHFWETNAPALEAWLKQFATDEGKVVLNDALVYGPQIASGQITITDAAAKLMADLIAKGMTETDALKTIVFNALRTQANASAQASTGV